MHELALSQAIADTVVARVPGRPVRAVHVRIGWFRQVVPESLTFCWDLLIADTDLDGARLVVEHVPAVVLCAACGTSTTLTVPIMACGACDAVDVQLVAGEELTIDAVELAEVA